MIATFCSKAELDELQPGQWTWWKYIDDNGSTKTVLAVCTPAGRVALLDKRWTITGNENTITVAPAIQQHCRNSETGQVETLWHGWLEQGHWRRIDA